MLIPSLFPFMILAGLISRTSAGPLLSRCVGLITRPMGLPERLGSVLLMSFVGGFPVGAQMLSEMLARREISRDTAERALCFCVNAGLRFSSPPSERGCSAAGPPGWYCSARSFFHRSR